MMPRLLAIVFLLCVSLSDLAVSEPIDDEPNPLAASRARRWVVSHPQPAEPDQSDTFQLSPQKPIGKLSQPVQPAVEVPAPEVLQPPTPEPTVEPPQPVIVPPVPETPQPVQPAVEVPAPEVPQPPTPEPIVEPPQPVIVPPVPEAPQPPTPEPTVEPPQPPTPEPTVEPPQPVIVPPVPETPQPVQPAPNLFEREGLGYSITYPVDWVYDNPSPHQLIFSGEKGTPAYYSTVSIQNIASINLGGKHRSADSVKKSLVDQLNSNSSDVKISDEKPFSYLRGDKKPLSGAEFMAEYTNNKERFRQWIIIVERPGKEVFHIWSYTSPIDQYDTYLSTAQDMLDSWMIK